MGKDKPLETIEQIASVFLAITAETRRRRDAKNAKPRADPLVLLADGLFLASWRLSVLELNSVQGPMTSPTYKWIVFNPKAPGLFYPFFCIVDPDARPCGDLRTADLLPRFQPNVVAQ